MVLIAGSFNKNEMKNIKTQLNNLVDELRISEFFEQINTLKTIGEIEIKDLTSLTRLHNEYIFGNVAFDYYHRLKAWVSINIVIVLSHTGENLKSNIFCQEIKDMISKGNLEKAITKLLEISQGKNEHDDLLLFSSQFYSTTSSFNKGIITDAQANQTYARITQAILLLLKELCEN